MALSGYPLGALARRWGVPVPADPRRSKGWIGQLIELGLGATAKSRAEPDFPHLGIELKTVPVRADGAPLESTYVTRVPGSGLNRMPFERSPVAAKLARVLWVPVLTLPDAAIAERVVGSPLLWTPDDNERALLQADWRDLAELVMLGRFGEIDARLGEVLQIRPKGPRGGSQRRGATATGHAGDVPALGFYLRPAFVAGVLRRGFAAATPPPSAS